MANLYRWIAFLIPILFFFSEISFGQNSATEMVRNADAHARGNTSKAEVLIRIVRPSWSRELTMRMWAKGSDYSMIYVVSPAKDRGTVFLKRGKEVWNWIPSIERSIKLPPSMMSQSWMGTDFTNDDLVKESSAVNDYTHTFSGKDTLMNRPCRIITMIPKPESAVVWGKVVVWIDERDLMQLKMEFYDEDGSLTSVITATEVGLLAGRMLPVTMEMIPIDKKGQKTVMSYRNLVLDEPIEDGFFSTGNMKTLR
jgi:outer membrane lipoprotein-sorting protein